jgi:hypothetical protein
LRYLRSPQPPPTHHRLPVSSKRRGVQDPGQGTRCSGVGCSCRRTVARCRPLSQGHGRHVHSGAGRCAVHVFLAWRELKPSPAHQVRHAGVRMSAPFLDTIPSLHTHPCGRSLIWYQREKMATPPVGWLSLGGTVPSPLRGSGPAVPRGNEGAVAPSGCFDAVAGGGWRP